MFDTVNVFLILIISLMYASCFLGFFIPLKFFPQCSFILHSFPPPLFFLFLARPRFSCHNLPHAYYTLEGFDHYQVGLCFLVFLFLGHPPQFCLILYSLSLQISSLCHPTPPVATTSPLNPMPMTSPPHVTHSCHITIA